MTVKSSDLLARYGNPRDERNMGLWWCPQPLRDKNPAIPVKIYANLDIHPLLTAALIECSKRGVLGEITSFGGCFNIRNIRGSGQMSTHSWGAAVDWNVADNALGKTVDQLVREGKKPFSERFLQCWRSTGWECGGDWTGRSDRQHFQIAKLP